MWYYFDMLRERCFKKQEEDEELKDLIYDLIQLQNELVEYLECKKCLG